MLIGCLLFIGLVINRSFIIMLLHKPEYANYFNVFIIVGVAFLVDMTGGLNGYIMNVSKYYKLTTVFIVSGVVFCVLSNLVLIPMLGMMGAALSYLITMFVLNFAYWLFVKIKFNLAASCNGARLYITDFYGLSAYRALSSVVKECIRRYDLQIGYRGRGLCVFGIYFKNFRRY